MTIRLAYGALALAILVLDQVSKQWASVRLRVGPEIDVIPGFLRLVYAENPGIAFSMFNSGAETTRWILAAFATATAIVVAAMALRAAATNWRTQLVCALLFAGIIGNLVDRARTGRVVDFIDAYVGTWHWPVFNVADSAISVGAVLMAATLLWPPREEAGAAPRAESHEEAEGA